MSKEYELYFTASAKKELKKLDKISQQSILLAAKLLKTNPYPPKVKKLKGTLSNYYRVRVGNYRLIYSIHENELRIIVIKVGHRKNVYKT